MRKSIIILLLMVLGITTPVFADDPAFLRFLSRLRDENIIPETSGENITFSDFEDSLAKMGYYDWFQAAEAENFVFSAHVEWLSSIRAVNGEVSGCGLVFGADPESKNHVITSLRMDGSLYVVRNNYNSMHTYLKEYISNPSMTGSSDVQIVFNEGTLRIYLDGQEIKTINGVSTFGPGIGFAVLSGINMDFGTRCIWSDIHLYSFQPD